MRDSMVLYRSFAEAMDELPAEQYKEAMQAITKYAMDGVEPDCTGVVKAIFLMAKPQIDVNNKRYENGKRGGRQRQTKAEPTKNQTVTKTEPKETKPEPNVNVNVNVNDNVSKEKEIIKKKKAKPVSDTEFEELWSMYPRKNGKAQAKKAWEKAVKEGVPHVEIKNGIIAYKNYIESMGIEAQYIKMGSTFFNQRAWEDYWTVPKARPKPKSNVPYQPEPPKYPMLEPDPEKETIQTPDFIKERMRGMFD